MNAPFFCMNVVNRLIQLQAEASKKKLEQEILDLAETEDDRQAWLRHFAEQKQVEAEKNQE